MLGKIKKINDNIDLFIGRHKLYYTIDVLCNVLRGGGTSEYFLYEMYKKSWLSRKQLMTSRQRDRFEKQHNHNDTSVLVDKYRFNESFSKYIKRDFLYMKDVSLSNFLDFVKKHPTFIAKKNWLCEGQGISKERLENQSKKEQYYAAHKGEYLVIEEPINQHAKMAQLHPESVNTIRVSTLLHNGEPHIMAAAMRIGTGDNCTDNLHNAGLACAIDTESGIVISKGYNKDAYTYLKHPDSHVTLLGFSVPNWNQVKNMCLEAAKQIPSLKWIGWDVAITEESCSLVEGNTIQGTDLIQVGQDGLWPKIKKIQGRKKE